MKKRTVSEIMLSVLLIGMFTLAFEISGAYMQSETVLYVCPSSTQVSVHTDLTVDITVADVIDLFAFGCYLGYNANILDILDVLIQPPFEGPIEISETESYVRISLIPTQQLAERSIQECESLG